MFHVEPSGAFHVEHRDALHRVAGWAGVELSLEAIALLARFARWLVDEALPAGGIGPNEAPTVVPRHVADALTFARGWSGAEGTRARRPASIVDLGSGAGLPGIPLAIAHPDASVALVDRSGRRVRLAERACRVLGLDNVTVQRSDIERPTGRYEAVVSRAAISPHRLLELAPGWAAEQAPVVVGGSTTTRPNVPGWAPLEVPSEVLASGGWLLIMAPAS